MWLLCVLALKSEFANFEFGTVQKRVNLVDFENAAK